jgi:phage-related protein
VTGEARWQLLLHPDCERELLDLKRTNDDLLTKVIHDLRLLREFGLVLLAEGRVKRLTPDVFELRTRRGSDINRVLFGVHEGRLMVLAASFVKKTQRTPRASIELAERRLAEWSEGV